MLALICVAPQEAISFNNDPLTSIIDPPITSTYNPAYEIGKHAAKLLLEHQRLNWTEKDF